MSLMLVSVAAALFSLALGILGLVSPMTALKLVGLRLDPELPHSISEVRATYGGIFIGMSLYAMLSGEPHAFLALGCAWLCAGASRIFSAIFDRALTSGNLVGIVVELLTGALVTLPVLYSIA